MGLYSDVFVSLFCVLGLSFLGWWLFGRLLRPIPGPAPHALIPGRGDGDGLEQTVRSFLWLRSLGLLDCPIVIANVDLSPQGWDLALRLTARWPGVVLWPASELSDYISRS